MIHAGSDLFLRACYAPHMRGAFPVTAYTAGGGRKRGEGEGEGGGAVPVVTQDIAGPLCFAGDVVVPAVSLPRLEPGDVVALHEAGGNTLSLSTAHCSRRRPPVYGYRASATGPDAAADAWGVRDGLAFTLLSAGTTFEQVLAAYD